MGVDTLVSKWSLRRNKSERTDSTGSTGSGHETQKWAHWSTLINHPFPPSSVYTTEEPSHPTHTHSYNCLYGGFPVNHLIQRFNIVVPAPKPNPSNKGKSCFYRSNTNISRHVLTVSKYSCLLCYYGYIWSPAIN